MRAHFDWVVRPLGHTLGLFALGTLCFRWFILPASLIHALVSTFISFILLGVGISVFTFPCICAVGGLGFEFCVFVVAFRSERPFLVINFVVGLSFHMHVPDFLMQVPVSRTGG